jgi:cell division protein FtsQ
VYVTASNEVELVPRVGNHIVLLGGLDSYEKKMNKLEAMYNKGFDITGWNIYSVINLKFKDQVICKRRNNG